MKPSTRHVLSLLRIYPHGLSPLEALEHGAGFRLGARIHELRQAGFDVETTWETTPKGARIARYRIRSEEPVQLAAGF